MVDTRHIESRFLAISQQTITRLQWNFAWESSFSQNFGNPQNVFFSFANAIGLQQAVAFVSSPIHLLRYRLVWKKTRTVWLHDGEKSLMMCLAVLIEYWRVTDRRTDRQTDILRQH